MAVRIYEFKVTADSIAANDIKFGGMQGERNATRLDFKIDNTLWAKLKALATDGKQFYYRFDCYDGGGGAYSTEPLLIDTNVSDHKYSHLISKRQTQFGGTIQVCFVITLVSGDETEIELYSYCVKLKLKAKPTGEETESEDYESITTLAIAAKKSAEAAEDAADRAEKSAAEFDSTYGVHVGTEEPTQEKVAVWINPDGKPTEIPDGTGGGSDADGFSPVVEISETDVGHTVAITDAQGTKSFTVLNGKDGAKGEKGADGYTPQKGVDYWTDEDKAEIAVETNTFISEELAKRGQLKPEFANEINECVDTSKLYVLPDGYIYAYMKSTKYPEITISEVADGYWYNNNGVATFYKKTGVTNKETDYIPVTEGDQLLLKSRGSKSGHLANGQWYDANKNALEIISLTSSDDIVSSTVTAPTGAAFVRFFSMNWEDTIATEVTLKVEWISCANATSFKWTNTGHAFVPADYEDRIADLEDSVSNIKVTTSPLKGKKIVYDGDSICASWGINSNGGAYPQIIADLVDGTFDNQGVGGGRFVTAEGSEEQFHSIVDNLPNLPTDADLYCFEGGVNDHWHNVALGDYNPTEYKEENLNIDKFTFCGAFETVLRYAVNTFVGKAVCVIIVHKCPYSAYAQNTLGKTFADYREKMIGICEKYAIPYYDAFKESGLNSWNDNHLANYFIVDNESGTGDGTHPNAEGYKRYYVPQLISLFESIIPVSATKALIE